VVVDLGSTNLTKVNGERIIERALRSGDQIHFSRTICLYEA
jgi:pSer/pThr/pTyr-binding forkhead associated (FHA) protein